MNPREISLSFTMVANESACDLVTYDWNRNEDFNELATTHTLCNLRRPTASSDCIECDLNEIHLEPKIDEEYTMETRKTQIINRQL